MQHSAPLIVIEAKPEQSPHRTAHVQECPVCYLPSMRFARKVEIEEHGIAAVAVGVEGGLPGGGCGEKEEEGGECEFHRCDGWGKASLCERWEGWRWFVVLCSKGNAYAL
jgi:hypothetical protein